MSTRSEPLLARRSRESGLALVEFTIMLPLFLLLLLGTAEVGQMISTYNTLTKRAESGARYLSNRAFTGSIQRIDLSGSKLNDAKNMAVYGNVAGTGNTEVPNLSVANVSIGQVDARFLQIDITYDYQPLVINTLNFFGASIDLAMPVNASVSMRAVN
jgi:hypothetical protein